MELGDIEVQVDATVKNLPYILKNWEKEQEKEQFLRPEKIPAMVRVGQLVILFELLPDPLGAYRGTITGMYHPNGSTQLYPFDEYMLNVTFLLSKDEVPREFIHGTTIALGIRCLIPGLSVTNQVQNMIDEEGGSG
ncbi:MAG: hypothetical protein FGF50_11920, partial [Candidatus Brockarchaeota archaeon]|nr:hypothetical protein [Candidatus Brockarchaeota archaeon]